MKKLFLMIVATITILVVSGCTSKNSDKSQSELIKSKGKIVLGVSPDYAPYEFYTTENGQQKVVGSDIYLAGEIAKSLGVELEIQQMSFDSLIAAINANKVDMVISGVNPTDERKKVVDFSDIYYTSKGVLVTLSDNTINSVEDLKNKKIGVQKGSTQESYAKGQLGLNDSNIQSLTDVPSLFQDLKNKKIDAVLVPEDVAKIAINQYNGVKVNKITLPNDPESTGLAVVFKKTGNNEDLLKIVNETIKNITSNNGYEEALDKYAKIAAQSE